MKGELSMYHSTKTKFDLMQVNYQEHSHPISFGSDSPLSELQNGSMKPVETFLTLTLNYLSNWKSGHSKYVTDIELAEKMDISPSYVSKIRKRTDNFIEKVKTTMRGTIYRVRRFKKGTQKPKDAQQTFAVPYGEKSPFQYMFDGKIGWKACLIWIVLKRHSNWKTGITEPTTILDIAKYCGFGAQTVIAAIAELQEAKLLVRISKKSEKAVFQLFPMPKPKSRKPKSKYANPDNEDYYEGKIHFYSRNRQWRLEKSTVQYEKRTGYKEWKVVDWAHLPWAIQKLFDHFIIILRARNCWSQEQLC